MNDTIYKTVLLHRYRDANGVVRTTCAYHFGEWICCDIKDTLKDEYLKYIGWLCSERNHYVRKEAVIALSKIIQVSVL